MAQLNRAYPTQTQNLGFREYLGSVGNVLELTVPVVLALEHASSVELTALQLHRHHVT